MLLIVWQWCCNTLQKSWVRFHFFTRCVNLLCQHCGATETDDKDAVLNAAQLTVWMQPSAMFEKQQWNSTFSQSILSIAVEKSHKTLRGATKPCTCCNTKIYTEYKYWIRTVLISIIWSTSFKVLSKTPFKLNNGGHFLCRVHRKCPPEDNALVICSLLNLITPSDSIPVIDLHNMASHP